jgi:hypothetical protein
MLPSVNMRPIPVVASSGVVANGNAVATLTADADSTVYLTGFQFTALGATALANVQATVTGLRGGTMTYEFQFPAGVTAIATPMIVNFPFPLAAVGPGTNVVVTLPAAGAGNTVAIANAQGFKL